MNRRAAQKFLRKWHRRLGVIIGIQLFFWTLGGAYFSWFHIDNVRGTTDRRPKPPVNLAHTRGFFPLDSLLNMVEHPVYKIEVAYLDSIPVYLFFENNDRVTMVNARNGAVLSPISRELATAIAKADFKPAVPVRSVTLVTEKKGEYKGPVPAYRIAFDYWKGTNVYVHANTGRVTAHRNSIWRGFDFLWMLHILDFDEREDFNNWVLRIMSLLGLITIFSGYGLWALTSPWFRRKK